MRKNVIRLVGLVSLILCLGCPSFPPRPDWVNHPSGKGSLLLVCSLPGKADGAQLQEKCQQKGKEKMFRFLRKHLKAILSNYGLKMGDLPDGQGLVTLINSEAFRKDLLKTLRPLVISKKHFYDEKTKKIFSLIEVDQDGLLFKLRNQMVEKLDKTKVLSPMSKEKAKDRLDDLLKREAKYLAQKFATWRTKENG